MFNSWKTAQYTFHQYLRCKANSATFIKRQDISNAFADWRYHYGDGARKTRIKIEIMNEYNVKLQRYWDGKD